MENLPDVIETHPIIDPEQDISIGTKAARALVDMVKQAGLSRKFGGDKEHLYYEAWQTLAKFYGCSIKTLDALPITINDVVGAKARAEIIEDATGRVVGGAEAYCMRDERNWSNKPLFQLMSMAQTRAGSKAARNKWAFVPALAGYATTPAEEMDGIYPENGHKDPPKPQITLDSCLSRLDACKHIVELKNVWEKHATEWKHALMPDEWVQVDIRKGVMKERLSAA